MNRGPVAILGLSAAAVVLAAGGCGPSAAQRAYQEARTAFFAADYAAAAEELRPYADRTDENFALQNARLGLIYLAAGELDAAEAAFLRAYEVIHSVGVNDGGRTLGAVLVDEKLRVWKGEPFERAMVSFYLGVVYSILGDLNNARAAYENALFRLRDFDDDRDQLRADELESNFTLASIMLGRTWQRLGRDDLASAAFRRAVELQPSLGELADPNVHRRSNVLLVVDQGYGPRRATRFDGSVLAFEPTPQMVGPPPTPKVFIGNVLYPLGNVTQPPVDLLALAQERRWQSIDTIRATKSAVGTGMIVGSVIMADRGLNASGARQRTDLAVAAGLLAGGLLLKATSQADVREWGLLPRSTYLLPLSLNPGTYDISVEFSDGSRAAVTGLPAPALPNETVVYLRASRARLPPVPYRGATRTTPAP